MIIKTEPKFFPGLVLEANKDGVIFIVGVAPGASAAKSGAGHLNSSRATQLQAAVSIPSSTQMLPAAAQGYSRLATN